MNTVKVKVSYLDENGNQVVKEEDIQYDPDVSGIVAEVEYLSPQNGGPVMRPRRPRL
jgi:hypothetical protein